MQPRRGRARCLCRDRAAKPAELSTLPATAPTRLTFRLLRHLLLVAACPRHLHLLVLSCGREGGFFVLNSGAFFLLPLGVPFFLLRKRERMVRGKAHRELQGSREPWSCPKHQEGCSHCRDPLPLVNPVSTKLWNKTCLLKAWQHGVTWPKTFDRCAMASLAPHGAPASASSERSGKNGTDTWTRDNHAEVTSARLARAWGSHVCS